MEQNIMLALIGSGTAIFVAVLPPIIERILRKWNPVSPPMIYPWFNALTLCMAITGMIMALMTTCSPRLEIRSATSLHLSTRVGSGPDGVIPQIGEGYSKPGSFPVKFSPPIPAGAKIKAVWYDVKLGTEYLKNVVHLEPKWDSENMVWMEAQAVRAEEKDDHLVELHIAVHCAFEK